MSKLRAFELEGYELVMYTRENINEPAHFNLKDRQRGLELKVWILASTEEEPDFLLVRPRFLPSKRSALDSSTKKKLGALIDQHRAELLAQWEEQIRPQQQTDLGRREP